MHSPLLRIANPQSLNRLGHFLTPDCKSGETPNENKELVIPCLEYGVLARLPHLQKFCPLLFRNNLEDFG